MVMFTSRPPRPVPSHHPPGVMRVEQRPAYGRQNIQWTKRSLPVAKKKDKKAKKKSKKK